LTNEIIENLEEAILKYNNAQAEHWARKAVEAKVDPVVALEALTRAVRQVGNGYGRGELWLPDLVGAASAMQSAMPIIEEELKKEGVTRKSLGLIIIGTVFGDIHSIGEKMVATLLLADGFEVLDLGVNVKAEQFIAAVKEHSPRILALSALMTTTAPEQGKIINVLTEGGLRDKVKIMVGGGAITQEFADKIGADGFAPTAPKAAELAKRLIV